MVQRHSSASPYEARYGFSRAVRTGDRIIVSGTGPVASDGTTLEGDAYAQARRCFQIANEAIKRLGGSSENAVRTRMYITAAGDADAVGQAHAESFGSAAPAATMVVVAGLVDPTWKVEIEVEASTAD